MEGIIRTENGIPDFKGKIDVYTRSRPLAKYLSKRTGVPYDSDGMNIYVLSGVDSELMSPDIFMIKGIEKKIELRTKEGDVIFPSEAKSC
jgi:hypothetical protein